MDSDYNPNTQYTLPARTRKVYEPHSYRSHWDPNQASTNTPSATEQSAKAKQRHASKPQSPVRSAPKMQHAQRQPDSRPISQEQLAAEVKSIYAGLTMVETKCIHVDRAEAAAASDNSASIAPQAYTPITSARTVSGPDRSSMNPSSSATDDPDEFEVQDNKFAFSPGQLRKLLSPKSLGVVDALGGKDGIEKGLRTDRRTGLSLDEATLDEAAAISFDEATTQSTSPDKRIYIPGFLGNGNPSRVPIEALPDKCAKYNFMKESEAKRLRLAVNHDITCSITLTKNKTIRTVGVVVALFTFRGETESHPLEFHLLRDCIHEVILGKPFLKATKTFSDLALRARRVVTNFMTKCTSLQLNFLGDSAPMFTGLLNGRIRQGLGDTGAQAPIMDEAFARAEGWHIEDHPDDIRTVQFADGSTADTVGMAYGVKWKFGLGGHSADYVLDFHILKDAPAGIILSDEFLYDTQAFAAYDRYLFDVDDEDDDEEDKGHLCAIKISKKLDKQGMYYITARKRRHVLSSRQALSLVRQIIQWSKEATTWRKRSSGGTIWRESKISCSNLRARA
jgi:hypothetical protein